MDITSSIQSSDREIHSGFVAIVGRANVGKSTLLNSLLGQKLAIVSPKPHTTRHKLLGVLNGDNFQAALLDTPGYLRNGKDQLDKIMAKQIKSALEEADIAILVAEPKSPGDVEQYLMSQIKESSIPALLILNKIDRISKPKLLPIIDQYFATQLFREVIPVSALTNDGIPELVPTLAMSLPKRQPLFPPDLLTDRSLRFLSAEIIREKVFQLYRQEIPYFVAVQIDTYEERQTKEPDFISATIFVNTTSQKRLLIGHGGQALKEVSILARKDIEDINGRPIYLELWVKVNPNWRKKAGFIQAIT
jgi:GTP-binding protein Era